MRFQFPDGQIVMMDTKFSRDGFNYPAEWLRQMSVEDRAAWGLTELPEPEAPNTPAPPTVPNTATPAKARLVLLANGVLDTVQAAVDAHPDPAVRIYWEYGLEYERNHPYIVQLGAALGLDLDDLFIAAAAIP